MPFSSVPFQDMGSLLSLQTSLMKCAQQRCIEWIPCGLGRLCHYIKRYGQIFRETSSVEDKSNSEYIGKTENCHCTAKYWRFVLFLAKCPKAIQYFNKCQPHKIIIRNHVQYETHSSRRTYAGNSCLYKYIHCASL